ncbi:MAG TPA: lyase family protein [Candidatus Paceibacterota bacterium]|nr:lyase family protein [Candidatus Pacearchaeota archaeon]HRZ50768.1 lyase family protein [Candidatus Paceibacterota bacterium]HSA36335.1 lyase family protein [Candidatus Paceibacterota bacterium]
MIPRYSKKEITAIFDPVARLLRFDRVEVAAVLAEEQQGKILSGLAEQMAAELKASPPDEEKRKQIEKETDHDFMAYIKERQAIMGELVRKYFHKGKTTFNIQDPADQLALLEALDVIEKRLDALMKAVQKQGLEYWYVPLLSRTHGQGAHDIMFGKRFASYFADLEAVLHYLRFAREYVRFGSMADMVGDYQNTSPESELLALEAIGLKPYYGATQILPRLIHAILASSLTVLSGVLAKIAEDIQLMARSPNPLVQEAFGKKQVGSTANPAKKNTIKSENIVGMFRLGIGNLVALLQNLITKEERDISQSSVERVALIDQFHILVQQLDTMIRLIDGIVVYPDRMYQQIIDMRGTEFGESAKDALAEFGQDFGITPGDAYNIIKLASHIVIYPDELEGEMRTNIPQNAAESVLALNRWANRELKRPPHIKSLIEDGGLHSLPTLDIKPEEIQRWKIAVASMLEVPEIKKAWDGAFDIERMLAGQEILRQKLMQGHMNY